VEGSFLDSLSSLGGGRLPQGTAVASFSAEALQYVPIPVSTATLSAFPYLSLPVPCDLLDITLLSLVLAARAS
jgi:hypothetical protein